MPNYPDTIVAPRTKWIKVAAAVKARREELNLSQADLTIFGGPSGYTISQVENARARGYRAATLARLETALDWRHGTIDEMLAEVAPTPVAGPAPAPFAGTDDARMAADTACMLDTPLDEIDEGPTTEPDTTEPDEDPAEQVFYIRRRLTVGDVAEAIELLRAGGLTTVAEYLAQQPVLVAA
jgi:transcriptional regulator with XRE-family HTH domain